MALLSVQRPTAAGVAVTMAAAAGGGDSFPNDGRTTFRARNAGAGPITITFNSPNACSFGVVDDAHDREVVVPNDSAIYEIGTFDQNRFNDGNSRVQVGYSGVTGLTVAAVAG